MGWLIALGILTLIAFMPIGALVQYDSRGFLVRIIAGWFRLTVYPMKKRKKKQAKEPGTSEKLQKRQEQKKTICCKENCWMDFVLLDGVEKGGSLQDFLPLVRLVLNFMDRFRKSMRINHLRLKLILAGDDPCDLAVNYGRAWAAMGNLLPMLERGFHIGKRDCEVECDFTAQETMVVFRLDVTLLVWQAVSLGVVYGVRFLKELLIFKKKRKGGAVS